MKKVQLVYRLFIVCQFFLAATAFSQTINLSIQEDSIRKPIPGVFVVRKIPNVDSVIDFGKQFLNKPYRYKGPSPWAMDCSGYLAYIFSKFGETLPHQSGEMAGLVETTDLANAKKGDLLFFKGRNLKNDHVGHVSMVIENNQGVIKMMHSCKRGIIIEDFNQAYYTKRFIKAGRIPLLQETDPIDTLVITKVAKNGSQINEENLATIVGVGDMMIGTNYPSKAYLPPQDGKTIFQSVQSIIENADISFGNLEGGFLTDSAQPKKCENPLYCYAFKMPDHYVQHFKNAGFDVLSIANNHVGDFGNIGRENTVKQLKLAGIQFAGLTNYPFSLFEKNGIKYAFCAFAPNEGTLNINKKQNAITLVKKLDSIADIVIVSFHGGGEGNQFKHLSNQHEIFLGEDRGNPYQFARDVIDAGADIVFGHGPHVTRAIDLYKGRFIAYSLGNFATYGRFNLKGSAGVAPIIQVNLKKDGTFVSGKIHSTKQVGRGIPQLDENKTALKEIISLTKSDFPNTPLQISSKGMISKK